MQHVSVNTCLYTIDPEDRIAKYIKNNSFSSMLKENKLKLDASRPRAENAYVNSTFYFSLFKLSTSFTHAQGMIMWAKVISVSETNISTSLRAKSCLVIYIKILIWIQKLYCVHLRRTFWLESGAKLTRISSEFTLFGSNNFCTWL